MFNALRFHPITSATSRSCSQQLVQQRLQPGVVHSHLQTCVVCKLSLFSAKALEPDMKPLPAAGQCPIRAHKLSV